MPFIHMKASFAVATLAALFSLVQTTPIEVRTKDAISSCGESWMAVDNIKSNHDAIQRQGFNSAVDSFCGKAAGQTVEKDKYLSMATRIWLDYGGDPTTTGLNGYVFFEIHNKKQNDGHTITADSCKTYLKNLASDGSKCFGATNKDTKGGTWQVGDEEVSYHALAKKFPPTSDSVDQTVILDGEIKELGDGGKGNTLSPFPTYAFNDITPFACHSHNDYDRDKALYSALSAGCISVEADVYVHGDKLTIGHDTDPGANGQNIQDLYLNPLKSLIDEHGGVFPAHKDQPFFLLIDFKTSGDSTWDALVKNLAPLRDAGYLSYYDNGFQQGKITIIATGNARNDLSGSAPSPIAKALSTSTNPKHAIFVDAVISKDMKNFNASNAYYASATFSDASSGSKVPIEGTALEKMKEAHDKGFKVRYWDIPGKDKWQTLLDQGVDRLNVDDLQDVAGVDWHL
ncbi:hypothetical protein P280DRAFT_501963 [Massarina eburnea CBS 473.64]|uniref:Altered inheritance of mitochondria protein 6 n=1 Tax=Massarina eburnea CBS 473.64 TaxID=1395130 RepID=A0A6A6RJU6_9PLEO|nr:hypothetical protein P280DRAFT_501963 [Massarina eburnea CBS 473.64]